MNLINDNQLDEIIDLIENKKWGEAEKTLKKFARAGDSRSNYYLGHIYNAWDNPEKDADKAKKYFGLATELPNPVANAFIRLAINERNAAHAKRILRKGLQLFPKNEDIYYQLLNYTDISNRENIYEEIILHKCGSEHITIFMAMTYFDLKKYGKVIEVLAGFEATKKRDNNILDCARAFSYYEIGEIKIASKLFLNLIEADLNHALNYIPHIGMVLILLDQNKISEAEQLIEEIPFDNEFSGLDCPGLSLDHWGNSFFYVKDYFLKAINLMSKKTENEKILGIVRGIRGLFLYGALVDSEPVTKKTRSSVRKDLECALKQFPQNRKILEHLFWISKTSDPLKAWRYLKQNVLNGGENYDESCEFIVAVNAEIFKVILNDFSNSLAESYYLKQVCKSFLAPIISRLFKEKRFAELLVGVSKIHDTLLAENEVLFEVAFSYYESKNLAAAKKYYELYIELQGENNAALNNLGLIFEKSGDLLKAKELYLKAGQLNNEDEICRRNLSRVEDELKKKGKLEYELQGAVEKYRNESPYVQKKILDFYNQRNPDGLIICSYRQAPQFLKMSGTKAADFLNDFISNKIFVKVDDHKYETKSNVYRLNPYLEPELAKITESLKNENELFNLCERLNTENLNLIGYNDSLVKNIAKLSSDELKLMLQRDLKENAIAVILKQNKSALILSGSIFEAILTDRIIAHGITKYKMGDETKLVIKMDLNDLLKIAENEKLINSTMVHLAHGVRGYRNLIHPGVEQRIGTIQVSDENVELAWGIVKKTLCEIK